MPQIFKNQVLKKIPENRPRNGAKVENIDFKKKRGSAKTQAKSRFFRDPENFKNPGFEENPGKIDPEMELKSQNSISKKIGEAAQHRQKQGIFGNAANFGNHSFDANPGNTAQKLAYKSGLMVQKRFVYLCLRRLLLRRGLSRAAGVPRNTAQASSIFDIHLSRITHRIAGACFHRSTTQCENLPMHPGRMSKCRCGVLGRAWVSTWVCARVCAWPRKRETATTRRSVMQCIVIV